MSAPVFLADAPIAHLTPGSTYQLDGPEGRHAGVVQRRQVGERVDIVDGLGTRALCRVVQATGGQVDLIVESIQADPSRHITFALVQALAKGDRDERAIEAATEVGVDEIIPWQADRSVVVWRSDRREKARLKWVDVVRAAAKQSRRASVPVVGEWLNTRLLTELVQDRTRQGDLVVVLHEDAEQGLVECVPAMTSDARFKIYLVVGPEGGLSGEECAALTRAGAQLARLGPHVLRTSTAGPVAIALLAHTCGYWAKS